MQDLDFDRVYAEYFNEVYKFALVLCREPNQAEELTQEAFFKALKNIHKFRGNCRITTWLCQIVKHCYYDTARRQGREVPAVPEVIISEGDIEQELADKDMAAGIHRALHRLREPYKEVFWLRAFGELGFAQIGALFDKTESWARVTYYRARMMIKEEMK